MNLEQSLLSNIPISLFSIDGGDKEEILTSIAMTDNSETLKAIEDVSLDFLNYAKVETIGELQDRYVRLDDIADVIYGFVTQDNITLDSFCNPKEKKVKRMHSDGSTEWVCVKKVKRPHHKGKKRGAMSSNQKRKISIALQKRAKRGLN
jgi:hypothetical protein